MTYDLHLLDCSPWLNWFQMSTHSRGPVGSFGPFAFWPLYPVFQASEISCHGHVQLWASLDEKCTRSSTISQNSRFFNIALRRTSTQKTPDPCTTASWGSNTSVHTDLACILVRSAEEVFATEKNGRSRAWATRKLRPRWACPSRRRSCGLQRLRSEGGMVSHNFGRPRLTSLAVHVICAFDQWVQ